MAGLAAGWDVTQEARDPASKPFDGDDIGLDCTAMAGDEGGASWSALLCYTGESRLRFNTFEDEDEDNKGRHQTIRASFSCS